MTYRDALREGAASLETETPLLDCAVLLAHAAGLSKEKVLASYPEKIPPDTLQRYRTCLERRRKGEPISYIRQRKEFFGRDFYVDPGVLVPRPDTEILVETILSKAAAGDTPPGIHDLCTGTGCIALTLERENPALRVTASDISPEAERVFYRNRKALGCRVPFIRTSLLAGLEGPYGIIASNPPYLPLAETDAMKERGWPEPQLALRGGRDGLDLIRRIIPDALDLLTAGGYLIMEAASFQMKEIDRLLENAGYDVRGVVPDLAGRDRVIWGRKGNAGPHTAL